MKARPIKEEMPANYIGEINSATLKDLPRVNIGEFAYCPDIKKYMYYTENGWVENQSNLDIKLYDLNKQLIIQMPELNEEQIEKGKEEINNFRDDTDNVYYMLYGKEISYFTLFKAGDEPYDYITLGGAIIDCLCDLGTIKSIGRVENGEAIEIWVQINDDATCLYLFPYDGGLVKVAV